MSEQPTGGGAEDLGGSSPAGPDRCPSCRARVVSAQQWCTLCHARLGEPEPPAVEPVQPVVDDGGRSTIAPTPQDASDGRPPTPTVLPPGLAEAMLAELAATTDRPQVGGPLAGRSRAVRTALAVSAALVLTAVGVALLTLVGLLL